MLKRFIFAHEDQPDKAWLTRFVAGREEAERWYLGRGRSDPPPVDECRAALSVHMPELLQHYDRVCALVGNDGRARQMLSHYRPPPVIGACSHAVWFGDGGPALVRNYDFDLNVVSDRFEATSWSGRKVIAKAQRPWGGCLDGMNEDGLVAGCAFGGSPAIGLGFSIILMLRYLLETFTRVEEAIAALSRIPIAQSHNVTLLDRSGSFATVFLGPDRAPAVTADRVCTNHQEQVVWAQHGAMSRTVERRDALVRLLAEPGLTIDTLVEGFLAPPLYSRWIGSPTVYTAIYRPIERRVDYLWPGKSVCQYIDRFEPGEYLHDYGDLLQ
jgi:predicted choloylglycine hydrolase